MNMTSLYDYKVKALNGSDVSLSQYKGQVALVVNVASKCGYTPQYDGLEKLYLKYKDKNFVILGFPSNDFGAQEPGSDKEIQEFCRLTYGVNFPLFTKNPVKGSGKQPVYQYLTENSKNAGTVEEVAWNFEKFLVDKDGHVIGRFKSKVAPESDELTKAIEKALNSH
jgi:glutathione peroxidase